MIYPVAVVVIAVVVVGVILWKVIPTFANLFAGLGAELPLPTRVVIALSNNLVRFGPFLIVGLVGASFGFKSYYATPKGRMTVDAIVLKLPILGLLMRKIAVARFCRTLSTLLASGVSILEALDITAKTAGNAVVEAAIQTTRTSIEGGETIAQPLKATAVFPPMVVQMIGVGEATGALDTMLNRTVAVKVLSQDQSGDDETLRRFQNEAQSAARLDHERPDIFILDIRPGLGALDHMSIGVDGGHGVLFQSDPIGNSANRFSEIPPILAPGQE
jgi:type II secretory pathway component PulF